MFDSSNSSLFDVSNEWKQKADETIRNTLAEINKQTRNPNKKSTMQQFHESTMKHKSNLANTAKEIDESDKNRQEWAKQQINDINEQTKMELESLEAFRSQQQQVYQAMLSEKNEIWENAILSKREEASQLEMMISKLYSEINIAKNESKADIEEAKRKAKESAQIIRNNRERQIQQIADLTSQIQQMKSTHENELKQVSLNAANRIAQKKEELSRLQSTHSSLKMKLKERESSNESRFRQQVRLIEDLRAQLQVQKDAEKQRQNELISIRKNSSSYSKRISAFKDEIASLKRQHTIMLKDNEELQGEIIKQEKAMFPQVFRSNFD